MKISLGSGDTAFTLDGMTGMGGNITNGATNLTIRNSTFTSPIVIGGASTDGVVLDANKHTWNVGPSSGGSNAKLYLENSLTGTLAAPSVTIKNSQIANGDLDGIHIGGGSGYQITGNSLTNLCDMNANHTDNIQFDTSVTTNVRIAGNYVYAAQSCATQGITSYDAGTSGVLIEDNVVDIPRDWGIELYADKNSIIRHNTVVYHSASYSHFNSGTGQIALDRKSSSPAGAGTQVYDNLAYKVSFNNGSTGTSYSNANNQTAAYVGPTSTYPGFKLSASSPVGLKTASDGLDNGIRLSTTTPTPTPTPSPTPSPSPTDILAKAVWTAPTGAVTGTAVTLDGTGSTGDGTLNCAWSFESADGTTVYETLSGCKVTKTFTVAETKYVKLTVTDADGDVDSSKLSFAVTAPAPVDILAKAVWTVPTGAKVGTAVTLDGTRSAGDPALNCTWTFEDQAGTTVFETLTGCKLSKTFKYTGAKYVKLTVKDADGDVDSLKQTFTVS